MLGRASCWSMLPGRDSQCRAIGGLRPVCCAMVRCLLNGVHTSTEAHIAWLRGHRSNADVAMHGVQSWACTLSSTMMLPARWSCSPSWGASSSSRSTAARRDWASASSADLPCAEGVLRSSDHQNCPCRRAAACQLARPTLALAGLCHSAWAGWVTCGVSISRGLSWAMQRTTGQASMLACHEHADHASMRLAPPGRV